MSESTWSDLVGAHEAANPPSEQPAHEPRAAVLACADARVSPDHVFAQPSGSLFTVRVAGNVATPAGLASLDYAVESLGVDLVIVLGHTSCGAVTAAAQGIDHAHLDPVVAPIKVVANHATTDAVDELAAHNVAHTMRAIASHGGPVGDAVRDGTVELHGGVHDLRGGPLRVIAIGDFIPNP